MKIYVHRIRYGRYVAIAKNSTIAGNAYCFYDKDGSYWIGGKHNYEMIDSPSYYFLLIYYFILKRFMPKVYKSIIDKSWGK